MVTIRAAVDEDFPQVLALVKELAEFQHAVDKVSNTAEQMSRDSSLFHCLLAVKEDGTIIGIATFFFAYFTWVGKSLYLDDLYVKPAFRKIGVGSILLNKIIEIGKTEGCKRIRWQVSTWNSEAISFYQKYGVKIDPECVNVDLESPTIASKSS